MNIPELLSDLGADVAPQGHRHAREGWTNIDCPWCGPQSGKYHLGISNSTGFTNCWVCGPKKLKELLHELTGKDYAYCGKLINSVGFDALPDMPRVKGKLTLPKHLAPLGLPHSRYLASRGFEVPNLVSTWGLLGLGISGRLSWRVFIPINLHGETVSWTTRAIGEAVQPRYLTAGPGQEKIHHKELLYGEDFCQHSIAILEGPTDVWRVGQGATCTFGTGFSKAQVLRASKYPVRVVGYDNQPEAQQQADKLCRELEAFPGVTYRVTTEAKDWGEASEDEVEELRTLLRG